MTFSVVAHGVVPAYVKRMEVPLLSNGVQLFVERLHIGAGATKEALRVVVNAVHAEVLHDVYHRLGVDKVSVGVLFGHQLNFVGVSVLPLCLSRFIKPVPCKKPRAEHGGTVLVGGVGVGRRRGKPGVAPVAVHLYVGPYAKYVLVEVAAGQARQEVVAAYGQVGKHRAARVNGGVELRSLIHNHPAGANVRALKLEVLEPRNVGWRSVFKPYQEGIHVLIFPVNVRLTLSV